MNKKIIMTWSIFLLMGGSMIAQEEEVPHAIIRAVNGSLLRGAIVEESDSVIILNNPMLETDALILKKNISRIFRSDKNALIFPNGKYHITDGNYFSYTLGFALADNAVTHLDFTLAKRLNERMTLGFGTGIHLNEAYIKGLYAVNHFVPFYGYGRYHLGKRKSRFFAFSKLGYGLAVRLGISDEHSGGPFFQPGLGVVFASRKKKRWVLKLSQYIQHTKGNTTTFDIFSNPIEFDYSLWYNRTVFNFGLEFR